MLRDMLEMFNRDGPDCARLRRKLPVLHREYTVRRQHFGDDGLTSDFREIGKFLDQMRAFGLLAALPIRYEIDLSAKQLIRIRDRPLPRQKVLGKLVPAKRVAEKKKKRKKAGKRSGPTDALARRVPGCFGMGKRR